VTVLDARPEPIAERAARFVDTELIPREEAAERAGGRLPAEEVAAIRRAALDAGLAGGLHRVEHGGQGWSHTTWALVEEQLGRATNGLSWHMPNAYNVLAAGTPEQIDRWLRPALRGEVQDAYAVTEALAGSDPSGMATVAERTDAGWRIRGEKWFVTSGDVADVHIVMAYALDGGMRRPTLFLVPADTPGITVVEDPDYTHSYPHGHPTLAFDVEVGPDAVLGGVGAGDDLQRAWFTEERLGIAARGIGAMTRLLEETLSWATGREQGGARLWDHQGVAFPLADSAADAAAGRLLCLDVARLADEGADPKVVHAKGLDGQAVRERGGRALRRPGGPGLRGTRLPARQCGRAHVAGAAGGPHLGGHERDPAPHRRARARAPRSGARAAVIAAGGGALRRAAPTGARRHA
jgi:alkylation response protein AidB-like acyl-CoA dehydrogenase